MSCINCLCICHIHAIACVQICTQSPLLNSHSVACPALTGCACDCMRLHASKYVLQYTRPPLIAALSPPPLPCRCRQVPAFSASWHPTFSFKLLPIHSATTTTDGGGSSSSSSIRAILDPDAILSHLLHARNHPDLDLDLDLAGARIDVSTGLLEVLAPLGSRPAVADVLRKMGLDARWAQLSGLGFGGGRARV